MESRVSIFGVLWYPMRMNVKCQSIRAFLAGICATFAVSAALPEPATDVPHAQPSGRRLPSPPPLPPPALHIETRPGERPMTVDSYSVDARVDGLFAAVSVSITFGNPNGRVLEGELEFPLPEGASVCGYALDVNGRLRDGVVVKKDEARIAFEAEVKAGIDPGLVEHAKGNMWNTRIYPIPANGARTIRIDYVTPLAFAPNGDAALVLAMPREKLAERKIDIAVPIRANLPPPVLGGLGDRRFAEAEAVWRTSSTESDVTPTEDVVVALPLLPPTFAAVEKSGSGFWFAASCGAPGASTLHPTAARPTSFRILWDASGSRRPADIAKARDALAVLPETATYSLVVFRDAPEAERSFASRAGLLAALDDIAYDGGTDFASLAAAVKKLPAGDGSATLLFTDGMDTLSANAKDISFNALALVSGGERDVECLRLACGGRVLDLATATKESILREIFSPSRFLANVTGEGVDLIQGIGQMAAGRVVVLGRLAADTATIRFDFGDGATSGPVTLAKADAKEGRTLARARAAKRIAQLSPRADDNEEELLALGREYGLASPKTSLIVLDTAAQYVKHGIEPPASEKELYAQWEKLRPAKHATGEKEEEERKRWLASLKRDWNERVEWHKSPVPKQRKPKSGLFDSNNEAGAVDEAGAAPEPVAAAAAGGLPARRRNIQANALAAPSVERRRFERAERATAEKSAPDPSAPASSASVRLAAWDPKTPYLQSLKDCAAAHGGESAPGDMLYRRYMELRAEKASSPAFFLDCAGFFFSRRENHLALRILSNLAEMRIEDPALLRTFAWRLREAGEYDRAIPVLRKVARLRPEEPHSFRDLALLLAERAKDRGDAAEATEAMELLKKTAFTPWKRQNALAVAVFALEELNALAGWCADREWPGEKPSIPQWDAGFKHLIDVDLRIILSWDADNTDIDIHVLEPSGEEAFFRNRRTASGGFVSQDITTGYGPEEYLQLKGQKGVYKVLTHYYGSSQQKLTGPATATATVYTDWGRPAEKRRILSLRLDKPKEKVSVGEIEFTP